MTKQTQDDLEFTFVRRPGREQLVGEVKGTNI